MGAECAGAVQFCPPAETAKLVAGEGGLEELSDDDVIDWLRRLRNDPAYRPDLALVSAGFSLAGMQPKIALRLEDDRWHVPWGAEPSNRIIKVTRHGAYLHEAIMEHLTMRTAARMGITTDQLNCGQLCCPPPGSSVGHEWAVLLSATGQIPLAIDRLPDDPDLWDERHPVFTELVTA